MEISDWKMELRGNDLATCISIQPEFKPYGSELDIDKTWQNSVKNHKKLQMDANGKKDKKDWPSMEATSKVPQVPRHSKLDKRGSLPCLVHRCWAEVHVTALGRFGSMSQVEWERYVTKATTSAQACRCQNQEGGMKIKIMCFLTCKLIGAGNWQCQNLRTSNIYWKLRRTGVDASRRLLVTGHSKCCFILFHWTSSLIKVNAVQF